jgi:hypothetical protein
MIPGHPFPGQSGHEEATDYLCAQRKDGGSNPAVRSKSASLALTSVQVDSDFG